MILHLILHGRWGWSHRSHHLYSSEWDTIDVFPPITPALVIPCLYRHCNRVHASLLVSSSAAVAIIKRLFFVLIFPLLCRISAHIRRVSAHHFPPRLFSPHNTVSFVPKIFSLMITRMFCSSRVGTPSDSSAILFY